MKTVFLYAGQGSQRIGMGKDMYEEFPEYREIIDSIKLDFDYKKMMEEGDISELSLTENTQPCMAAFAAGVTNVLKKHGVEPDGVCGLSLGEYGALHCAGVFDAKDYVNITAFRGRAMADAAKGIECSMSAILGLDSSTVEEACKASSDIGFVTLVNYNCPGQYVICGDETAVVVAETLLKERGAKRCVRLNVSGPFHTKYMESAGNALRELFEKMDFKAPQMPIALNVTGDFYNGSDNLKEILEMQVKSGVHFEESIQKFLENGAEKFIEIGPGATLSGFVKKIAKAMGKEVSVVTIDTANDLKAVLNK